MFVETKFKKIVAILFQTVADRPKSVGLSFVKCGIVMFGFCKYRIDNGVI